MNGSMPFSPKNESLQQVRVTSLVTIYAPKSWLGILAGYYSRAAAPGDIAWNLPASHGSDRLLKEKLQVCSLET